MAQTFVYAIRNIDKNEVKIGYTIDPIKRLSQLQCATTDTLEILCTFSGGLTEESILHQKLDEYRITREWFRAEYFVLKTFLESVSIPVYNILTSKSELEILDIIESAASKALSASKKSRVTVSEIHKQVENISKKQITNALSKLGWTKKVYESGNVFYIKPKP